MGDFELTGEISLVPIFVQKNLSPSHQDYYQILLTDTYQIIKEPIFPVGSLDKQLENLYNRFIAVSFEWPLKSLSDCRKNDRTLEITYSVKMPLINGSIKTGKLVNPKKFHELEMEAYYGRIVYRTN